MKFLTWLWQDIVKTLADTSGVYLWSGWIMIENTTEDVSKHPITATSVTTRLKGIIQRGMIPWRVSTKLSGVTTNWYCRTDASDIAGYRKLLSANANTSTEYSCSKPQTDGWCAVEEFATDAGAMDGVNSSSETTTFRIRAKWSKTGGSDPLGPWMDVFVYHRDTSGTETQIAYYSEGITSSYVTYTESVTINKSWGTNERLVVKFRFRTATPFPL